MGLPSSVLAILLAYLVIVLMRGGTSNEAASCCKDGVVFLVKKRLRVASMILSVFAGVLLGLSLTVLREEVVLRWFSAGLLLLSLLSVPSRIVASDAAVELRWLWFTRRRIPWKDAEFALADPQNSEAELVSRDGEAIKHSRDYIDQAGFLALVRNHVQVHARQKAQSGKR